MSDQQTTENFWQVWNSFVWPDPVPIVYRCYLDDNDAPDFYTMEDLPGRWIEVSREIYMLAPRHARVKDGQLEVLAQRQTVSKLVPDPDVGRTCHPKDVCVVVDNDQEHQKWSARRYEID